MSYVLWSAAQTLIAVRVTLGLSPGPIGLAVSRLDHTETHALGARIDEDIR